MPLRQEGEERVRPAERNRREVVSRRAVVRVDGSLEVALAEVVACEKGDGAGVAGLDSAHGVLEEVDAGGAAIRVLHQPADTKAKAPRQVDRVVGMERERRDAEAIDRVAVDSRIRERSGKPIGE